MAILFFQLFDFPDSLICCMHEVSPQLFYAQWVSPSLRPLDSRFQIRKGPHPLTPILQRQVSRGFVHQPAKVCILQSHLRTRRCVGFRITSHPAFTFPVAVSIPGLLDAIGLFADEELAGKCEDRFIAVGFDFATILSCPFWGSLSSWNSWRSK